MNDWHFTLSLAALLALPSIAHANGVTAHAHMSDLAVDALPPGDLHDLLTDPDVRQALRSGSVFPDSGYALHEAYGEIAHWEPFTDAFLRMIVRDHPPPWTTLEDRQRVAFLFGMMSHGMADQVDDSLFMHTTIAIDGTWDTEDEYADTWLIVEHAPGIHPLVEYVPAQELHEVLLATDAIDTAPMRFEEGVGTIRSVLGFEQASASRNYESRWLALPYSATHYYVADAPGSLPFIASVIARYWEVVWQRLHGTDSLAMSRVATWPEDGALNFDVDPAQPLCRTMMVFGHAIDDASFSASTVTLRAQDGTVVPSHARFQWSNVANAVLVLPDSMLAYDTEYTVELGTGVRFMDGRNLPEPVTLGFRTRCADDHLADCPPLPEAWVPPTMPPPQPDAGPRPDAGRPPADAGSDAATDLDAASPPTAAPASCACHANPTRSGGSPLLLLVLAIALRARRR